MRSTKEAVYKRKPDLRPYRDPCDPRLTVSVYVISYLSCHCVYCVLEVMLHGVVNQVLVVFSNMHNVLLVVEGWISEIFARLGGQCKSEEGFQSCSEKPDASFIPNN